jgi:glutathione S-transferase
MAKQYKVFGAELSPYSVKIRSYFRYKKIPHKWVVRNPASEDEYKKYAKIPIIPLVVTPEEESLQDSTPIIEAIENRVAAPTIHPNDAVCKFLSTLIEEFGDEWGNKWFFHLRWARDEDCLSAGGRVAALNAPGVDEATRITIRDQIIAHMKGRVFFVGSNEKTAPLIEQSFSDGIQLLENHFSNRAYLFGGKPCLADFGLWGQLYCAWTDPTGGALIESSAPNLLDWIHRMLWPTDEAELEEWESLAPTLMPFIKGQIGDLFAPWTVANTAAMMAGEEEFSVQLKGQTYTQKPQKYHVKSLQVLREKYAEVSGNTKLAAVLQEAGSLAAVQPQE